MTALRCLFAALPWSTNVAPGVSGVDYHRIAETKRALRTISYTIGEITVQLSSETRHVAEEFETLYGPLNRAAGPMPEIMPAPIRIDVKRAAPSILGNARFQVHVDGHPIGKLRFQQQVLPAIEWAINFQVIARRGDFPQFHSAAMAYEDAGVLLAGESGVGMSTLIAGLLARRWRYFSDEFAMIHPRTLLIQPFPKAVCIKSRAFPVVEKIGLPFAGRPYYLKGLKGMVRYINPRQIALDPIGRPCPVRFVLFPRYVSGAEPELIPISRGRAAFLLLTSALNRQQFGACAAGIACEMVRRAECFALRSGSLGLTCDLVESLFASSGRLGSAARSDPVTPLFSKSP